MERLDVTPRWFAARLADDTANLLRIQPGPIDLADYYDGLAHLQDAVETSMTAIRQAAADIVNSAVVR
jgi:hypothetical protein